MHLAVGDGPVEFATGDLDLDLNGTPHIITVNEGLGAPAAAWAGSPMPRVRP